ncbi:uracil-DNA glycosylase [Piscibacillus halophilus]|uniref:uracil-DNA glycosylase n=1 Tax=Piscibacillus halophilus TaxID=571933 RepID=UPI00240A10B4|nr:uracil-DNA glycosylase [Piscibacillus halophilus]
MNIQSDWKQYLDEELQQPYFNRMMTKVETLYETKKIYPPKDQIFKALNLTSFQKTKVVILGQDPYHGQGQANGLSFSVNKGLALPPSLKNIYKELINDLGCAHPPHGDLSHWAEQGVLLLNTVLTVEEAKAHSHKQLGWERLTDRVIEVLNNHKDHVVFILWGKHAQKKGVNIDESRHLILTAPHPSPLSAHRGFFGSQPFSKTNTYLSEHGKSKIDWCF